MLHQAQLETAKRIGQIQGCYKNVETLLVPTVNQVDFEKALAEDNTKFYLDKFVKSYAAESLKEIESEQDAIKKGELAVFSANQLNSLERVDVVFDGITKSIFVDAIDPETKTYKDNGINRLFNRVGNPVK